MNEISKELAQEALDIIKGTKAFIMEQAPDVVQQIVRWKTAESIVYLAFSVGAILVSCLLGYIVGRHREQVKQRKGREIDFIEMDSIVVVPCSIFGILAGIAGAIGIAEHTMVLLKLYYAPKVFLIEYLSTMLR